MEAMNMPEEPEKKTEDKLIFKYNDGFSDICEDPFEIEYRIQKASELEDVKLLDSWIADIPKDEEGNILESADRGQYALYREALHRYVPIIRAGFLLKPFDRSKGEGLTGPQVLDLYANFIAWKFDVKKNTE